MSNTSTLTKTATTNINVGNVNTDESVIIQYVARRGSYSEIGKIIIVSPFIDYTDSIPLHTHDGEGIGMTMASDYSGSNIRLKITVDSILEHDITFDYNIELITETKIVAPPLGIPSTVAGVAVSLTQINLTWLNNCLNTASVCIERSDDLGLNYTEIVVLASGTQSYSNTGLTGLTHYYYRIRLLKDGVYSHYSSVMDCWSAVIPTLQNITVETALPTKVVLTYDYALNESSTPATSDFIVVGKTISSVLVSGTTVTLTISVAFIYDDIITIYYTPGVNRIKSSAGDLDAASIVAYPATNNVLYAFTSGRVFAGTQKTTLWTMTAHASADVILTVVSGGGYFYSNKEASAGETDTKTIPAGTAVGLYFRPINSGTPSVISCNDPKKITTLRVQDSTGVAGSYLPYVSGNIGKLTELTTIQFDSVGYGAFNGSASTCTKLVSITDVCQYSAITGDVTLMTNLVYINITGAVAKFWTGDLTNKAITYFIISGAGNISNLGGDIGTWPKHPIAVGISAYALSTLSGSLENINCATVLIGGNNAITHDLGKTHASATSFTVSGGRIQTYTYPHTWNASMVTLHVTPSPGYGLSSDEIDNLLIDLANSNWIGTKVITLTGSNAPRTSASDAAYTHLTVTHGCTITLNT